MFAERSFVDSQTLIVNWWLRFLNWEVVIRGDEEVDLGVVR